jgi:membrane fusion protein, multidrug efflux system
MGWAAFGWLCVAAAALGCAREAEARKGAPESRHVQPIPVTAALVTRGDVGIYLSGIGSVVPLRTVTVRTRVDGQIMQVAFKEGQMVEVDQLLAQIDPRPFQVQLELARGQLARDRASLDNANIDLERYEPLAGQNLIPRQQADTQRALVRQLEGMLQSDRGNVDNARLQLSYARITAPIRGRAGLRLVDPGNIVHAADPNGIVVLTQLQPISVVFAIAEDGLQPVLQKLRAGQELRVEAFDRELKQRIAVGKLLTTDNQIDPATGTLRLRALFDNEHFELFPNQFVNPRLLLDVERDRALVPAAALQRGANATSVFVVKPDHTVTLRDVTIGPSQGNLIAVERGLSAGERVVVQGADRLHEGSAVVVRDEPVHPAPMPGVP